MNLRNDTILKKARAKDALIAIVSKFGTCQYNDIVYELNKQGFQINTQMVSDLCKEILNENNFQSILHIQHFSNSDMVLIGSNGKDFLKSGGYTEEITAQHREMASKKKIAMWTFILVVAGFVVAMVTLLKDLF